MVLIIVVVVGGVVALGRCKKNKIVGVGELAAVGVSHRVVVAQSAELDIGLGVLSTPTTDCLMVSCLKMCSICRTGRSGQMLESNGQPG